MKLRNSQAGCLNGSPFDHEAVPFVKRRLHFSLPRRLDQWNEYDYHAPCMCCFSRSQALHHAIKLSKVQDSASKPRTIFRIQDLPAEIPREIFLFAISDHHSICTVDSHHPDGMKSHDMLTAIHWNDPVCNCAAFVVLGR